MDGPEEIRKTVSASYSRALERLRGPGGSCCGGQAGAADLAALAGYHPDSLAALPAGAAQSSFGCGNPVAFAGIREGDTVLDLGSGAGLDLLLAARLVGPAGLVIGVDMTEPMLARARANAAAAGLTNVEVRKGLIEDLPVASESVDFVISNCVINLSPEKVRVFAGIFRVLRPGGRFSISDIVADSVPDCLRADPVLLSACIAGAIPEAGYLEGLRAAGLADVRVVDRVTYDREQIGSLLGVGGSAACCGGAPGTAPESLAEALAGRVASIRVAGRKPELSKTPPPGPGCPSRPL